MQGGDWSNTVPGRRGCGDDDSCGLQGGDMTPAPAPAPETLDWDRLVAMRAVALGLPAPAPAGRNANDLVAEYDQGRLWLDGGTALTIFLDDRANIHTRTP